VNKLFNSHKQLLTQPRQGAKSRINQGSSRAIGHFVNEVLIATRPVPLKFFGEIPAIRNRPGYDTNVSFSVSGVDPS
jgi:hypothetical protein